MWLQQKLTFKMKILMLNNEYPPLGGGQANANYYLCEEFKKYPSLKVDLITASIGEHKEEKSDFGTSYYLNIGKKEKNLHFQSSKELALWSLKALSFSKKLLKKEQYDLIIAWSGVPAGYLAYKLNKKTKVQYVVLLRGADVPFWEKRWEKLDKHIFSWLSPKVWKNSIKTIANSSGLKTQAKKIFNGKIDVIPNGVDINFFKPLIKKNKILKIISVGRLIPRKNFDLLIESVSEIKDNFELQIVGDGPEKENLMKLIKEKRLGRKVKLLGLKNKKEISKLYSNADVYCLSSSNEGMSNTVLEAMASGLPIITTNVAGSKELVKDNGFIVPINAKKLKEKIEILLKNSGLRKLMGKKSRKYAKEMGWKKIADKFYQKIKECLK